MVSGLVCAAVGCSPPRGARHVTDPDPSVKIPAIRVVAKDKDRHAIPTLVEDLSSDDPAVRFYAIEALIRLTGDSMGYNYYASDTDREISVKRWNEWLKQQPRH